MDDIDNLIKIEEFESEREAAVDTEGTKKHAVWARGPVCAVVNAYGEQFPVYAWLMLADGRWYDYHRVAIADKVGEVNFADMQQGELLIHPGLVYRRGITSPALLERWAAAQARHKARLDKAVRAPLSLS